MDFYELVKGRTSVRSYDPNKKVSEAVLMRILEAGRLAPSACNLQPWRFILVESETMLSAVKRTYDRNWIQNAPHILIVVGRKDQAWTRNYDGYNSIETDLAIAMDHMVLAAEYEDVATCWVGNFEPTLLREVLKLTDDEVVFDMTPLGYPEASYEKRPKKRKALNEILTRL